MQVESGIAYDDALPYKACVAVQLTRSRGYDLRFDQSVWALQMLLGFPASTDEAQSAGAANPLVPADITSVAHGIAANHSGLPFTYYMP